MSNANSKKGICINQIKRIDGTVFFLILFSNSENAVIVLAYVTFNI